jgi:hypothetical protein
MADGSLPFSQVSARRRLVRQEDLDAFLISRRGCSLLAERTACPREDFFMIEERLGIRLSRPASTSATRSLE